MPDDDESGSDRAALRITGRSQIPRIGWSATESCTYSAARHRVDLRYSQKDLAGNIRKANANRSMLPKI
jgi:hypothetical protein